MSSGFNLNIFNYSQPELEELLSLTSPFQNNDVETSCLNLRNRLFRDHSKTADDKVKINGFLEHAKARLIKGYRPKSPTLPPPNQLIVKTPMVDDAALLPNEYQRVEFAPTYPTIIPPKNLNPMEKRIIRRTVNIDTRFRDNYYKTEATDLHVNLPTVVKNAISMKLVGLELPPCSIYSINKRYGNHFFHIKWNTTYRILIGDGRYSGAEMVQAINNALDNHGILDNIQAGIDEVSCKMYFTFDASLNQGDGLIFNTDLNNKQVPTNLQLKMGWMLGFTMGTYEAGVASTATEFLAEAPYDGTGAKYLFLVVDDYNNNVNNYFMAAFNNSIMSRNILARIPQYRLNNFSNMLVADDINDLATSSRNYFGPINVQKLKIQLVDEYGRIVYINNRDFSLALEFDCIYN